MRRLTVFAMGALAGLWALSAPASAEDGDWACIYVTAVDTGVCQQNPLPEESPVPVPDEVKVVPDDVPRLAPLVDSVLKPVPDAKPDLPDLPDLPSTPGAPNPASLVPGTGSLVPGGNPLPGDPTSVLPGVPVPPHPPAPYVPSGMPGTPI